jgi:hypothetical protein
VAVKSHPLGGGDVFDAANSTASCAQPRCSIEREPLRHDHTIGTAVAPDDVFTGRT